MGLIITNSLHTNQGITNEMYLNIEMLLMKKDTTNNIIINRYLNFQTREENPRNKCDSFDILSTMNLNLTIEELESNNIYPLLYSKIKLILENRGFTVINDILPNDIDFPDNQYAKG
jgi:hypothetical protein